MLLMEVKRNEKKGLKNLTEVIQPVKEDKEDLKECENV